MSVINVRWVPAALDYNGARAEVDNAKHNIDNLTQRLASESDKLNDFLRRTNEENSSGKVIQAVSEKEYVLRKLEVVNEKVKNTKKLRKEQSKSLYNKYC
jgi:long-subunit acyl-CoA synthetase (AMP-forming)